MKKISLVSNYFAVKLAQLVFRCPSSQECLVDNKLASCPVGKECTAKIIMSGFPEDFRECYKEFFHELEGKSRLVVDSEKRDFLERKHALSLTFQAIGGIIHANEFKFPQISREFIERLMLESENPDYIKKVQKELEDFDDLGAWYFYLTTHLEKLLLSEYAKRHILMFLKILKEGYEEAERPIPPSASGTVEDSELVSEVENFLRKRKS